MSQPAKRIVFLAKYAGEMSEHFWRAVNRTKDRTLYDFACALQDLEGKVLAVLNTTERKKHGRK